MPQPKAMPNEKNHAERRFSLLEVSNRVTRKPILLKMHNFFALNASWSLHKDNAEDYTRAYHFWGE